MPLLKLWNCIRGRSAPTQGVGNQAIRQSDTRSSSDAPQAAGGRATRREKAGAFSLFGGGRHAGLRKQLRSVTAGSVLEISVQDGTRAVTVVQTLAKRRPDVRYIAIDQFELCGGDLTLKQFHRHMRSHGIRPRLFPAAVGQGLTQVANTLGQVDLILIPAEPREWRIPHILPLISRVSHPETLVLYLEGEDWKRLELGCVADPGVRRAA